VKNDNFLDADVYVVANGMPRRVGMVIGLSTASFKLNPNQFVANDFRVVARTVGGGGTASSGPLSVRPGDTVAFTLGARLALSFAVIR